MKPCFSIKKKYYKLVFNVLSFIVSSSILLSCSWNKKIDYNTHVKPIINKNCISCHGGVKKQGGFSLLFREEALAKGKSGRPGIVPGDADASEMYRRLVSTDLEERMPHHKDPLKKEDIETLKQWIDDGAEFSTHWAYKPLEPSKAPDVENDFTKNYIDQYVYQQATDHGLEVSKEADPITLSRRVSFDLVGFPLENIQKTNYLKNPTEQNYQAYVNSLLASPYYGEKWTSMWLDLARYADTKGFERDNGRVIWKYRDWLIKAFNKDMPYDQFLTNQLAGDLLPNVTEDNFVATAYHRNTMTNDEGGTDNEEYRVTAVIDRVNTTWETLMGTTFACVQCHSHPYDPFTHEEYYKFMALFNNSRDEDTFDDYPVYRHYNAADQVVLDRSKKWLAKNVSQQQKKEIETFLTTLQPSYNSLVFNEFTNAELSDSKFLVLRNNATASLANVSFDQIKQVVLKVHTEFSGGSLQLHLDSKNGPIIGTYKPKAKSGEKYWELIQIPISATTGKHKLVLTYANGQIPAKDNTKNAMMFDWLHFMKEMPGANLADFKTFESDFWHLVGTSPEITTPVMMENPSSFLRKNQLFERGAFTNRTKEVTAGVPKHLANGAIVNNRLELAQWLGSKQNPLVARTMVNRLWEQLFGAGLVETLEDLGSQGAKPVNQALLDDLSYKFMTDYNWSMKTILKTMVLSSTYRQDSKATDKALELDRFNTYLARGPRIRLSGEQIRDHALSISGLLNTTMYGPPVMPFQPKGVWSSPYNGAKWETDSSKNKFRRAVYTYWKRTSAYPSLTTFDGVGREVCLSRRIRTNTPLQAFVTLNDSAYVEMAYQFAKSTLAKSQGNVEKAISIAYQKATGRVISKEKQAILLQLFADTKKKYALRPKDAQALAHSTDPSLASMTLICNTILNLDEVITKS
jgi:hypothetical protein